MQNAASRIPEIALCLGVLREDEVASKTESTRKFSEQPHRFVQRAGIAEAIHSSDSGRLI